MGWGYPLPTGAQNCPRDPSALGTLDTRVQLLLVTTDAQDPPSSPSQDLQQCLEQKLHLLMSSSCQSIPIDDASVRPVTPRPPKLLCYRVSERYLSR